MSIPANLQIEDFNQLFGCPAEGSVTGWTDYQTDATVPLKVRQRHL